MKTDTPYKYLYYLFLLLIPASIFRVNASIPGFESFFLFRVVLFLISIILVFIFLFDRKYFINLISPILKEKYLYGFLFIWILFSWLSYFWILSFESFFRYSVLLSISVVFVFIIGVFVNSKDILREVWKLVLFTLGISVFVGLLEIFFGLRLPGSTLIDAPRSYLLFVTSFFNHPNDFASYITVTLPFLTLLPLYKNYKKYKWWILIFIMITVFVLTFTGSKINYIATLIGALFVFLILYRNKVTDLVAYSSIVIVLFFSFVPSLGPDISAVILSISNRDISEVSYRSARDGAKYQGTLDEIYGNYGSFAARKNLIVNSVQIIEERPQSVLIGLGAGQIEKYMEDYDNTDKVVNLHNWWVEVITNHGIIIGLGYISLYLYLFRYYYQKSSTIKDSFHKYIHYSILVILVVLAFTSASPSSSVGYLPLWFTLGFAIAAKNLR